MKNRHRTLAAIALLAAGLLYAFLVFLPNFLAFLTSFQAYNPAQGIAGSPWIGLSSYKQLLDAPNSAQLIVNSKLQAVLPVLIAALLAFGIALGVGRMNRSRLRALVIGALLVPAFIPDQLYAMAGAANPRLVTTEVGYQLVLLTLLTIKYTAFFAFVSSAATAIAHDRGRNPLAGAGGGVFAAAILPLCACLTPNPTITRLLANPAVYQVADTLDLYAYRTGLLQGNFGAGTVTAAGVIKVLLQLVAAVLLCLFARFLLRGNEKNQRLYQSKKTSLWGMTALAGAIAVSVILFVLAARTLEPSPVIWQPFVNTVKQLLLLLPFFCLLLIALSFGLYHFFSHRALCILLLASAVSASTIGNYFFYRKAGMMNTIAPVLLSNLFNLSFVLCIAYLIYQIQPNRAASLGEFLKMGLPYLVMFVGVTAANYFGEIKESMIYLNDIQKYGLGIAVRNSAMMGQGSSLMLQMIASVVVIAAVSIGLFALTSEQRS